MVKKAVKAAGTEETGEMVNNTIEEENMVPGADNKATEGKKKPGVNKKKAAAGTKDAENVRLAYIGPSLPAGRLKTNKVFIGTRAEIEGELKEVLEKYPLVRKLLVPVEKMAEKKDRVKTAGNILNKYYSDLVSVISAEEVKEV